MKDQAYIESKLEALQHHAETVLEHIYDQAKQFDESETSDSKLTESQRERKTFLMQQLDNIEAVLKHLEAAEVHKRDFTFEEYEVSSVDARETLLQSILIRKDRMLPVCGLKEFKLFRLQNF